MTPDVQAAAERVRDYLDAWAETMAPTFFGDVIGRATRGHPLATSEPDAELTASDLRTLLAALDPADEPSGVTEVTDEGRAAVNAYRAHRTRQNPHGTTGAPT